MKIVKITYQYRRDFRADFVCEGCNKEIKGVSGYDDLNFHENIVPIMKCPFCKKSSKDLGVVNKPWTPKYPEGYQI